MSRQLFYSLALLITGTLIAAFLIWLRPEPVEVERAELAPLVEVVPLQKASGAIPVLASGTVQPREEVTVAAQVSGRLTYVNPEFREGGVVAQGATLLRIEQSDYLNQMRVAEADVAAQGVAVLQAEEEVAIAREELSRFAAREQAAGGASDSDSRILPPRAMDNDEASVPSPERAAPAAKGLATREPQLASAKAALDRAKATLADAKLRLNRTRVRAPFGAVVRDEAAAVGQLVQSGERLGSLVARGAYEVRVSLTADEAALIPALLTPSSGRVAASVTMQYGGMTYRWPAFVDRANAILDPATRNIEVYVRVPSPLNGGRVVDAGSDSSSNGGAPPLLLGAFVDVEITGAALDSYAEVPARAVRPGNEIWVVRGGKLEILKVRLIQRSDEVAYIVLPSLAKGGQLVISSLTAPIEGMPVRIAGTQSAPSE